ncbi:alanine racemase [Paenibacillus sp. oral taxon 786 str. D14]|uniref:alanine racemase n=1 Tax=Paenibacillus sp. oral taxon 786 TaxID=652715 RepID=UPI0001AFD771|nr:alanine racemase [Paenibacillus sp. oral taxon 786]EES71632.1 alanine racemase [Paenibacillus sp. oral taxon 786 str. D14]
MQVMYRPTHAEIDLDALRSNFEELRRRQQDMKMLACVKANAYGHGAVPVAKELEQIGADYLSVAFLDEALELRKAGIQLPILVLGYTPPHGVRTAWEHDVTLNVFSNEVLEAIEALNPAEFPHKLKVHIKIDSGMGRVGLLPGDEAVAFVRKAMQVPHVEVEGLFTHYATADEEDKSYTLEQYRRFQGVVEALREHNIRIPIIHTGNSAIAIDMPELSVQMVRIGIALYGLYPSDEVRRDQVKLTPVLSLKTETVRVKTLPAHSAISYGARYITEQEERIATLPIGYADGYSRMLNGKAQVLIRGRRVPVTGVICMDQCMVSLQALAEEAEEIQAGEEVVLIGRQAGEEITAGELASAMGTIHYELICMLAHRVPRVYKRKGESVLLLNPLL